MNDGNLIHLQYENKNGSFHGKSKTMFILFLISITVSDH